MMKSIQKELARYPAKRVLPLTKPRLKPFDVETTFAEVTLARKEHTRKYHGPDSLLYSAIYPVVCVMKVFGLAPYDFTGDEITPSNACLIFSFVFIGIYCHIIYIVYKRFLNVRRDKAILSVVETTKVIPTVLRDLIMARVRVNLYFSTVLSQVTVNYLVAMHDLIFTIFTRKTFSRIWNAQQDFDERLSQLGYPRKETKIKIAAWILLASQIVIWTAVNQSGMFAFEETWTFNVSYMCTYIGTATAVYKFFGMASFLGLRFHQLNQIAKENLPPRVGYKSSNVSRQVEYLCVIDLN